MKFRLFLIILFFSIPLIQSQTDTEKKWNYKSKPYSIKKFWKIKEIKLNPNGYELYWIHSNDKKENSILFRCSEKYFLLKKLLNKIPYNNLIQEYWTDEENPHFEFFYFISTELEIEKKDIKYDWYKGDYQGIYSESILSNLDESKYPIKIEFEKYIQKEKKHINTTQIISYYNRPNVISIIYLCYHDTGKNHSRGYQQKDKKLNKQILEYYQTKRKLYVENTSLCTSTHSLHPGFFE